ncbi:hypothetical protein [Caulobacter sp. 17J80-11]|uniref:hypothetical protein n=1 Tax=Caulobacter sp. 17J80-11 TaxID=2763502 RepID=UPI0016539189|nr:hypothetical protein [Caulobacter sp. 17J80-11]MBC6980312.1 hypothetical protein [Caulobacter sp. 17J80-11]
MKKVLASVLFVSALAAAAPVLAAPGGWQSINERQARLDQRIDIGVRNGSLTRHEARSLRAEFNQIARLEARYRQTGRGLEQWERRDLDARFDRLSARIKFERHDRDGRGRYDDRYDRRGRP